MSLAVHEKLFETYLREWLGHVHDFYMAEVTEFYSCTRLLEDNHENTSTICCICNVLKSNEL